MSSAMLPLLGMTSNPARFKNSIPQRWHDPQLRIGDIVVGFESVLALKERIRLQSDAEFVWVAVFRPGRRRFFARFFETFPIFDSIYDPKGAPRFRLPVKVLTGASVDVHESRIAMGSV